MKKFLLSFLCAVAAMVCANAAEVTFDFVNWGFPGADAGWTNSYGSHVAEYDDATVTFTKFSKQTTKITDQPVGKDGDVVVSLKDASLEIRSAKAVITQWGTKAQTALLSYSLDGTSFIETGAESSDFSPVACDEIPAGAVALKLSFSNSGNQVGVASITITTGEKTAAGPVVAAPTFSVAAGTYYEAQSVALESATEGANIYYTLDGTDPTTSSTPYSKAIAIGESCTLKAIAELDGTTSPVVSAEYVINIPTEVATIGDALALDDASLAKVTGEAIVLYHNGKYTYVTDLMTNALLFGTTPDLQVGDMITGFYGKVETYTGEKQLSLVGAGETLENVAYLLTGVYPMPVALTDITADLHNANVLISNVTISDVDGKNFTITDAEGNTLAGYNKFTGITLPTELDGKVYNVAGFVCHYVKGETDIVQFYPVEFTEPEVANVTSISPAEGDVTSLNNITITFDKKIAMSNVAISVLDEDGEEVTVANRRTFQFPTETSVSFSLFDEVVKAGTYKLVIEAGSFAVGETASPSSKYEFTYNVDGSEYVAFEYEADPEDGSTVSSLSEIRLTCNYPVGINYGWDKKVTVKRDGLTINVLDEDTEMYVDGDDDNIIVLSFEEPLTEAGDYTIEIEEGMFNYGEWGEDDVEAITLNYTVEAGEPATPATFSTLPASGSTVESLNEIILTSDAFLFCNPLTTANATIAKDGVEMPTVGVDIVEYDIAGYGVTPMAKITLSQEITEEGEYTITIPEGFFLTQFDVNDEDEDPQFSPELTFTWTVDAASGIASINSDNLEGARIFNLQGVEVKAGNLTPGIYVVNGKKVVIRK